MEDLSRVFVVIPIESGVFHFCVNTSPFFVIELSSEFGNAHDVDRRVRKVQYFVEKYFVH